jgi:hypothetical protein
MKVAEMFMGSLQDQLAVQTEVAYFCHSQSFATVKVLAQKDINQSLPLRGWYYVPPFAKGGNGFWALTQVITTTAEYCAFPCFSTMMPHQLCIASPFAKGD